MIELDVKLNNIEEYIGKLLKKNLYESRRKLIKSCPYCSSEKYIKYGYFKGIQRYKCKECGKTFSLTTNTIYSYTKKPLDMWIKFIELMLEKRSLKYCGEVLNININTAFYWRHKVMKTLTLINTPKLLKGVVHMTNIQVKENFKGCRAICTDVRNNIFVTTAKGEIDSILSQPISKCNWSWNIFNEKVYKKISEKAIIIPYKDRYIRVMAQKHNEKNIDNIDKDNFMVNFYYIFEDWFKNFHGIATKYLEKYLCWFILFYRKKIFQEVNAFNEFAMYASFVKVAKIRV